MIKSVIFDIDNTLYNYDVCDRKAKEKLVAYCKKEVGWSEEEFFTLHQKCMKELGDELGKVGASHSRMLRYQRMLEESRKPLFPHAQTMCELYWKTLLENMVPEKGIAALFSALGQAGIRIGIGSNMTAYMQFRKLTTLSLGEHVTFMVTSEEAPLEKPDPGFFQLCVKKAGCFPEECLFIGDSRKNDVEGAEAAGLKAVWYAGTTAPDSRTACSKEERIDDFESCLEPKGIRLGQYFLKT